MPSFIDSQRHNLDRLLAAILLWNVAAGVFVTLGAPWLAEIAGTTLLRPPTVLPTGSGWLAIGVPTHAAGIWLSSLGMYALHRMRRHWPWHLVAVLFYAPQTFAILSPLHVDMWMGLFAATSFQPTIETAIAVNWLAMTLFLTHAWLGLLDSKYRAHLEAMPSAVLSLCRAFWGVTPLSRAALSRRYACIATVCALLFLPLFPVGAFYPSPQMPYEELQYERVLLLLPVTFVIAYVLAFVWSGGAREPRFSGGRGMMGALLSYLYLAMAADLLSRWLSHRHEMLFALLLVAWLYLLPLILAIPAIGWVIGDRLGRRVAAPSQGDQPRSSRLTWGMWLTLVIPLLGLWKLL